MRLVLLLFLIAPLLFAQHDWQRWNAKEISYEVGSISGKSYEFDNSTMSMTIVSGLKNAYYFLISDLDGDNCPFYPSCSTFFVESVKETNIFQGALMFSDRFTRDLNLLKDTDHYKMHSSGKLFDPAVNYSLNPRKFILSSHTENIEVK